MKKQEFFKNEEKLRNIWDNFKLSSIQTIGVPEGEEEDQEIENSFEKIRRTSGQDGGVGRHTVPPCTTKRTTNLKTKNNQNCQFKQLNCMEVR